jgi:hypothetical protein
MVINLSKPILLFSLLSLKNSYMNSLEPSKHLTNIDQLYNHLYALFIVKIPSENLSLLRKP